MADPVTPPSPEDSGSCDDEHGYVMQLQSLGEGIPAAMPAELQELSTSAHVDCGSAIRSMGVTVKSL